MKIHRLQSPAFAKYGWRIEIPGRGRASRTKNLFRIVVCEDKPVGWRIAYLVVRDRSIDRLEQHPDTFESFEPLAGRSVLFLARGRTPQRVEAFYLDKPIVLRKGIWHGVVTVSREADIKIMENACVKCVYHCVSRLSLL